MAFVQCGFRILRGFLGPRSSLFFGGHVGHFLGKFNYGRLLSSSQKEDRYSRLCFHFSLMDVHASDTTCLFSVNKLVKSSACFGELSLLDWWSPEAGKNHWHTPKFWLGRLFSNWWFDLFSIFDTHLG